MRDHNLGRPSRRARWLIAFAVIAVATATLPDGMAFATSGSLSQARGTPTGSAQAQSGTKAAGNAVRATTYPTAPKLTASQRAAVEQGLANSDRPGPAGPTYAGATPEPVGPPTTLSGDRAGTALAPGDLTFFRNTTLPAGGTKSAVDEPSTDANGKITFATGNWYAAYSKDKGGTWTYLDPFTIFGSGFCCDQVTVLDTSHNQQFWLLQYNDHLTVANSSGQDLVGWCFYNWTPASFGLPAGYSFDYNHMALSTKWVYVSTNVYNGASFAGALVFRTPIDEQTNCAGFSYGWAFRSTEFAVSFVQPAMDTMYWGTNWTTDLTLGSTFRILRWADDSGGFSWYDRSIDSYTFMVVNGGQNCGSANGVVLNWCQRTDSRQSGGGYLSIPSFAGDSSAGSHDNDAVVGFAFNAKNDGGHSKPFIRRVYFRASDLTYLGYSELFNSGGLAHLYPDMAVDARGHVGMVFAWGGGSGTDSFYPGSGIVLNDDLAQAQPWSYSFYQFGSGNPCLNTADGFRRWGDYLTVRAWTPSKLVFIGTGFALNANAGNCNVSANVAVKNVVFGRVRDTKSYKRWAK
jgi:hypothetical protein